MAIASLNDQYQQASLNDKYSCSQKGGTTIETELDVTRSALQQSRELSNYAMSIVSRLCGSQPEPTSDGVSGKEYDPEGVFPQIAQDARRAMSDMSAAMSALRRLERLGS